MSTATNISQCHGALGNAGHSIQSSLGSVRHTNAEYGRQRDHLDERFAQKIDNTKVLSQQLSTRLRSVNIAIEHSEWSMKRLKASLQGLLRPRELCKERVEKRRARPQREQIVDSFQEALHQEEAELERTKQTLMHAVNDTRRVISQLQAQRSELEADLGDKRHALSLDSLCVERKMAYDQGNKNLDKSYSRNGNWLKAEVPEMFGDQSFESAGCAQERLRQEASMNNLANAHANEAETKERWQKTNALLERCNEATNSAHKRTQEEMGRKIQTTEHMRKGSGPLSSPRSRGRTPPLVLTRVGCRSSKRPSLRTPSGRRFAVSERTERQQQIKSPRR